jgi:microsomal dipeptidase-like Zn-dependent dipeptidase
MKTVHSLALGLMLCLGLFAKESKAETAVFGIADMHAHPFANEGFGGLFFQGKSFSPLGLADALPTCESAHGSLGLGDLVGNAAGGRLGHGTKAFPSFAGWPRWNTMNHQQVYYKWLKRAHEGGLRLIVSHAVNSEALCSLMKIKSTYGCNDMKAVDRQIDAAYALEKFVDAEEGGLGKGWLAIVKTPAEARIAIGRGKLAMVLGIEVDSLFDCKVGACQAVDLEQKVAEYYAKGIRHVIPVHLTDNAFGGAAMYNPYLFNYANKKVNGNFFTAEDCSAAGYTYQEMKGTAPAILGSVIPSYPPLKAFCNARGLSPLGETLLEAMMKRNMIIDIDHMSAKTLNATLTLAEARNYPLASGHTGFIETSTSGQKRSEAQKTDLQLRRIMRLGGVVGPILQQGNAESEVVSGSIVANDCDRSSKAFAQAFLYAKSVADTEMREPAVAYGSDFNGLIEMPSPRFGSEACGKNKSQAKLQGAPIRYPLLSPWSGSLFNAQKTGDRIFDYNLDGFAQIGLLPEFIQDLENVGLSANDLSPLFRSAEAYIQMWEKTYGEDLHN